MRRSIVFVIACALALAGCASGPPRPLVTAPAEPHTNVVAKDIAFDTASLTMAASQPTTIYFVNADDAPHNIEIAAAKDGGGSMFAGEIINKGAIIYQVPGFGAGSYFFLCKVHPNMNGTVTVTP